VNSNLLGCTAEYKFATMAMENGLFVSMPLLDSSPYDCIIELPNYNLRKIQIKSTAKPEVPRGIHVTLHTNNRYYKLNEVDYFAIWVAVFNGFFIIKNTGTNSAFKFTRNGKYSNNFNNFAIIE
tara:strand:+ start:8523 stop:8894 length:372 start_codon:yes stop_codon:yes gene_type:complete